MRKHVFSLNLLLLQSKQILFAQNEEIILYHNVSLLIDSNSHCSSIEHELMQRASTDEHQNV